MVPCHLKYFSALGTSIFDTDKRIKQRQVKLQIDGSVREGQSGGAKTYDVHQRASVLSIGWMQMLSPFKLVQFYISTRHAHLGR